MPHATRNLLKSKKDMAVEIVFALAGLAFVQLAYLTTIRLSNAATATVLQNLNPVMIMIFVCLTHRKLPTLVEFICIILAIAGTFIVATHGSLTSLSISPKALFFGLLTAFACCVYTILPVQLMKKFGSMPVIGIGMLVGGIIMTLFVQSWKLYVPLDFAGWLGVILMVVVGTAFAFTFFLTGVKEIGPVYGSIIGSLEPLTAAILGLVWLHTPLSWIDGVGFMMIIITVFLISTKKDSLMSPFYIGDAFLFFYNQFRINKTNQTGCLGFNMIHWIFFIKNLCCNRKRAAFLDLSKIVCSFFREGERTNL